MRLGRAAGLTDTGRRRLRNEDAFVCEPPLFAVTDGMGGARAGEIAAELAATALEEGAAQVRGTDALVALVEEANRRIWQRSVEDPQTTGMGAVATVALVEDGSGTVAIGHVGDSRAYLLREGGIEQLTRDHSLVAELVESGVLTPEEAERHPQRSAITRALGTEPSVEVDAFTVEGVRATSSSSAPTGSRRWSRTTSSPPRSRRWAAILRGPPTRSSRPRTPAAVRTTSPSSSSSSSRRRRALEEELAPDKRGTVPAGRPPV